MILQTAKVARRTKLQTCTNTSGNQAFRISWFCEIAPSAKQKLHVWSTTISVECTGPRATTNFFFSWNGWTKLHPMREIEKPVFGLRPKKPPHRHILISIIRYKNGTIHPLAAFLAYHFALQVLRYRFAPTKCGFVVGLNGAMHEVFRTLIARNCLFVWRYVRHQPFPFIRFFLLRPKHQQKDGQRVRTYVGTHVFYSNESAYRSFHPYEHCNVLRST